MSKTASVCIPATVIVTSWTKVYGWLLFWLWRFSFQIHPPFVPLELEHEMTYNSNCIEDQGGPEVLEEFVTADISLRIAYALLYDHNKLFIDRKKFCRLNY